MSNVEEQQAVETYEAPRVEDLGTFTELTKMRTVRNVTDNGSLLGTR